MLGGEWFNDLGKDPDTNDIIRIALESLRDHMGVTDEPSNIVARVHKVCENPALMSPSASVCLSYFRTVLLNTSWVTATN